MTSLLSAMAPSFSLLSELEELSDDSSPLSSSSSSLSEEELSVGKSLSSE